MTEFICRLGTPSGEIVTRIVEASAASEARARLEGEGFRVFAVSDTTKGLSAVISGGGKKAKVKQADFLLFNQQLSALLRAGIPVLQSIELLKQWPYPLVAQLRDSQAYVMVVGLGRSLFDYHSAQVREHQADWQPLLRWLKKAH